MVQSQANAAESIYMHTSRLDFSTQSRMLVYVDIIIILWRCVR